VRASKKERTLFYNAFQRFWLIFDRGHKIN